MHGPFSSLQDALLSFDFRLSADSPCVGAGARGGDLGYPAGIAPLGTPRSRRIPIQIALGRYVGRSLVIPSGTTVYGAGGSGGRPVLQAGQVLALQDTRLSGPAFHDSVVKAYGAALSGCDLCYSSLSLHGASAADCSVLNGRTFLGYGSATLVNCLLRGDPGWPALGIQDLQMPHELANCTITGCNAAIRVYGSGHAQAHLTNCILVLCPSNILTKSLDFAQDGIRGRCPDKGF